MYTSGRESSDEDENGGGSPRHRRRAARILESIHGTEMAPRGKGARLGDEACPVYRPDIQEVAYWFCSDCGGRVYGERDARPDLIAIRAGTLDDTSWLRPIAHVYMRSAQSWEQIPDKEECFETMPKDLWSLTEKWRQLWQTQ
jgi:hypothetical protein